ncbi:hypothetical protein D9M71_487970 [compost metagenome]
MVVLGQRSVSLGVVVHVVDKAIEQLVGGVKIQQLGIARPGFDIGRTQAAHSLRQALLVGRQFLGQAHRIGVGQGAAGIGVEQFGQGRKARLDGGDDLQRPS